MPQLAKGGVGGAGLAGSNHVNADITPTGLPSRGAIGEMTLSNTFADQLRKSHLKSAEVEKMCTFTHVCMYIITSPDHRPFWLHEEGSGGKPCPEVFCWNGMVV